MGDRVDETSHVMFLGKFENRKTDKENMLQEIIAAICAMLNSNGGKVVIHIDTESNIPVEGSPFSQMSLVTRILEQSMISIIGLRQTISLIDFKEDKERIDIFVQNADSLITTNYNLCLPSETQVVQVSPQEPLENVKHDIINRKVVLEPVQLSSHGKIFFQNRNCRFQESKTVQLKKLQASPSKCVRLPDRITGKGNKFSCYVAAFANYSGGHIYYGIRDDGVVEGELILNEKDKSEIIKKVEKAINKMIWPEQIGQPKRGEHWEIFFEPVVDENAKPIPLTFVIVIYIASCLGGVFLEEPECYEMVAGEVRKMSFDTWKKVILHPVWLRRRKEIPCSVSPISWSSAEARKAFTVKGEKLRQLTNNGDWKAVSKECQTLLRSKSQSSEMKLLVLSKQVTACCRKGDLNKAPNFLDQYQTIVPQTQDRSIFEVIGLYLQAALKRASGDFKALGKLLAAALSKAELIEPGLVTATIYVFAATVADLVNSEDPTKKYSPETLSIRALDHLRCVQDHSKVLVDMERKVYVTLATFYLGCNISGQPIKDNIDISCLKKAKTSITAVHQSTIEAHPLSWYRDVQLKLVQSIYNYRYSQNSLDERVCFLRNAFDYAKKAECLAKDYQFTEMLQWSKANQALCTVELVRACKFRDLTKELK